MRKLTKKMLAMRPADALRDLGVTCDAIGWAEQFDTCAEAWEECSRPDWMLRFLELVEVPGWNDSTARLFACWCVRRVWHLMTAARSTHVVLVAERFARGAATADELAAARVGALAAREDALARLVATRARGWVMVEHERAASASAAAWEMALATALEAAREAVQEAALASALASAAAWEAERSAQCCRLRKILGNPFKGTTPR